MSQKLTSSVCSEKEQSRLVLNNGTKLTHGETQTQNPLFGKPGDPEGGQ